MTQKHGGARSGAGRKAGKVSQAKRDMADLAKDHAEAAFKTLADIASKGESEAARVSASVAILDRAYGKPRQAVEVSAPDGGPVKVEVSARERIASRLAGLAARAGEAIDTNGPD